MLGIPFSKAYKLLSWGKYDQEMKVREDSSRLDLRISKSAPIDIKIRVARQVHKFDLQQSRKTVKSTGVFLAEKLNHTQKSHILSSSSEPKQRLSPSHSALDQSTDISSFGRTWTSTIPGALPSVPTSTDTSLPLKTGISSEEKVGIEVGVVHHPAGTSVYYGATIALKARHGGYISYSDPLNVRASAHKVLPETRFTILSPSDPNNSGLVKYGDCIWLQAGQHEILGANFSQEQRDSRAVDPGKRNIRPALINCRRANFYKAQQYGRWVIMRRDDPLGSLGEYVHHTDRVILEQEWYFLSSSSPSDSRMHRISCDIDQFMLSGHLEVDLFRPSDDCCWTMCLLALPHESKHKERQMQKLFAEAVEQLEVSGQSRVEHKFRAYIERATESKQAKDRSDLQLSRKLDIRLSNQHFIEKRERISRLQWSQHPNPKTQTSFLPGSASPSDPHPQLNSASLVPDPLEGTIPPRSAHLDVELDKYWDLAQTALVDVRATDQMRSVMQKYYIIDREKKEQAALRIQKWIRTVLQFRFSYLRRMRRADKAIRKKLAVAKLEKEQSERSLFTLNNGSPLALGSSPLDMYPTTSQSDRNMTSIRGHGKGTFIATREGVWTSGRYSSIIGKASSTSPQPEPVVPPNQNSSLPSVRPKSASVLSRFRSTSPSDNRKLSFSTSARLTRIPPINFAPPPLISESDSQSEQSSQPSEPSTPQQAPIILFQEERRRENAFIVPNPTKRGELSQPSINSSPSSLIEEPQNEPTTNDHSHSEPHSLQRTRGNRLGLPRDVFEGLPRPTPLGRSVGLRFLRCVASKPELFEDVHLVKRRPRHSESEPCLRPPLG